MQRQNISIYIIRLHNEEFVDLKLIIRLHQQYDSSQSDPQRIQLS